ncbi:MAG: L-fucose:H+ symporter permease [Saprospiraceae bacterium]|jgi:FHS family L-fucose permease-like MFS transporter|nr:L-fucose:H+ symporter permease [Saprospiraceae bacterium]
MSQRNKYLIPFILITSLFFMWGIANNLNGILIPHLRKALQLTNLQSTLVDTAVYLAYFLMAIPAGIILKRFGYKKGIIMGLLIFATGALLFIPAANMQTYSLFLGGLFILGCGLTLLETAANPYATRLGDPEDATFRINLAQSFNGLAVFIAPIIGTLFILSGKEYTPDQLTAMPDLEKIAYLTSEAQSVKMPYMILGGFLIVLAIIFYIMDLPEIGSEESKSDKAKSGVFETLKYNHVRWAVIAQFFYVGAQVCVTSFFIRMAISGGGVDEKTAGWYLSAYGLLFMIGRFVGSAFVKFIRPAKLLSLYSFICILLSLVAIFADGKFVVLALGGLGFFMSIMFPTIFSLGIEGLKEETKPASSLIVMAIIGGAIFPVIMGGIIDSMGDNIQIGYIVPFLCFFVVWYFGWKGHKVFINPVESLS